MFDDNINKSKLDKALEISCCKDFLVKKNIELDYLIEDYGKNFPVEKNKKFN